MYRFADQFAAMAGEACLLLLFYYWLWLAESHLTRRLFGSMLRRVEGLPLPAG
jgi:low temperature requirement protein LtrA